MKRTLGRIFKGASMEELTDRVEKWLAQIGGRLSEVKRRPAVRGITLSVICNA